MLKRNLKSPDREWQLQCNACRGKQAFPGATAFTRIVEWPHNNGWKARTHSQIWEHICPKCQQAQLDERYLERLRA